MNVLLLPLSILCGLILCATAISLFAVYRAHSLLHHVKLRAAERQSHEGASLQALRDKVDALSAQIHDLQSHPPVAPPAGLPKPGLNLSKRSQALRMHRHGEGAAQIASALELPRQEVDLLLKVHRIILSSV
jgi:cell division protein FtsB